MLISYGAKKCQENNRKVLLLLILTLFRLREKRFVKLFSVLSKYLSKCRCLSLMRLPIPVRKLTSRMIPSEKVPRRDRKDLVS